MVCFSIRVNLGKKIKYTKTLNILEYSWSFKTSKEKKKKTEGVNVRNMKYAYVNRWVS